ncbi:MAG: rod-binding protein [Myxococcales bacterium]|nr:rod-binding protein [Myxococcales bacterium]
MASISAAAGTTAMNSTANQQVGDALQARAEAANARETAEVWQAARAFETIFIQQIFGEMRNASSSISDQSDLGTEIYSDMLDQSVAAEAANQGGIGLAELVVQAWGVEDEAGQDSKIRLDLSRPGAIGRYESPEKPDDNRNWTA